MNANTGGSHKLEKQKYSLGLYMREISGAKFTNSLKPGQVSGINWGQSLQQWPKRKKNRFGYPRKRKIDEYRQTPENNKEKTKTTQTQH